MNATNRMLELSAWLRGLGCCAQCRLRIAINQVARELGEAPMPPLVTLACAAKRGQCIEIARANWKDKPQGQEKKAA